VFVNEAGELYSSTPPPALLHVCSESRRVTLKRHKPWLPQFKNYSGYERFHYLIEEHGIERLSKLQRVWVDFQGDELILNGSLHDLPYLLGPVDERLLTSVGLQIRTITTNLNLRFLWVDDYDATSAPYLNVLQLQKLHSLRTFSVYQFHARRFTVPCGAQNLEDLQIRMNGVGDNSIMLRSMRAASFRRLPRYKNQSWISYQHSSATSQGDDIYDLAEHTTEQLHLRGGASTPDMLDLAPPDPESPVSKAGSNYHTPGSEAISAEIKAQLSDDLPDLAEALTSPARQSLKRARDEDEEDTDFVEGDSASLYVVEKFRARRETPQGVDILVEWEGYPDETDWTWETEASLKESAPEMVEEWHRLRVGSIDLGTDIGEKQDFEIEEVERIIYCRNIKKVPHYLVSWKGYPEKKDQTWERCDKLRTDVPILVDEYERQRKKRKK
jgi:hypothetical protein